MIYVVGIANIFNGTCTLYKITAPSPKEAQFLTLEIRGYEIDRSKSLEEQGICDEVVSEPILINE